MAPGDTARLPSDNLIRASVPMHASDIAWNISSSTDTPAVCASIAGPDIASRVLPE